MVILHPIGHTIQTNSFTIIISPLFKRTFNQVADGHDNSALRFFPESALRISSCLELAGNEHVLDVATGTGCAALSLAKDVPDGHVTGVDFSTGMLAQAKDKSAELGFDNVTFVEMDMQAIEFPDDHFDIAVSSFSIFFVDDNFDFRKNNCFEKKGN